MFFLTGLTKNISNMVKIIMPQLTLPYSPRDATKSILKKLFSRRMRDVIEKRFGLKNHKIATLESIGKEYKITRERVRQIEADALKFLRKDEHIAGLAPIFAVLEDCVREHGGVMTHKALLAQSTEERHHHDLTLLLTLNRAFHFLPETEKHEARWSIDKRIALGVEDMLGDVTGQMERRKEIVSWEELREMLARYAGKMMGKTPDQPALESYLAIAKTIQKNPYGEYGLAHWPSIRPIGVKDKAYAALRKARHPLHFRAVAAAINTAGWNGRRAHPQTVHNELIKDNRFILVGRGLYGLAEWGGYEPGGVREILVSLLRRAAPQPVSQEEAIQSVLAKRAVKAQTVLLNLQDKSLFRKTDEGKYLLV